MNINMACVEDDILERNSVLKHLLHVVFAEICEVYYRINVLIAWRCITGIEDGVGGILIFVGADYFDGGFASGDLDLVVEIGPFEAISRHLLLH